jgi:RNA polymerase sigma factor (sigma-70 family)
MAGIAWQDFAKHLHPGATAHPAGELARTFVNEHVKATTDPASTVTGAPPMFGRDAVPHLLTFQSLVGTFSRAYLNPDEAMRDSIENAHLMRKDVGILECVENRQRLTALLDWEILPEDESNVYQVALARELARIIKRINRFPNYRFWLMDAIWAGRAGIQHRYGWQQVNGRMRLLPTPMHLDHPGWLPVNGDKIVYRYDDGFRETDRGDMSRYPHQMGLRVSTMFHNHERLAKQFNIEPIGDGLATFLAPWERETFCVHKHFIEDADFHYAHFAGSIHGVGIRSRIYWEWFLKQEAFAFLMQYLERSAGGIEIWTYPIGDDKALAACKEAAEKKMANGRNVVFFPRPLGEDGQMYDFQIVEPGAVGLDIIQNIVERYFGGRIKRYILGQELSTETHATGLGSGVADAHMDTLSQVVQFDARNLEATLTHELVRYIQKVNFPETLGWHMSLRLKTDSDDAKMRLDAMQAAWSMNAAIPESEVLKVVGVSAPKQGERVLQQQPPPPQFPGIDPSMLGGDPAAAGVDISQLQEMLAGNEQFQRMTEKERYAMMQRAFDFDNAAPGSGAPLPKPSSKPTQRRMQFDESQVNRESTAHGDKKPGEFAPKNTPKAPAAPPPAPRPPQRQQSLNFAPEPFAPQRPNTKHDPPKGWESAALQAFPPASPPSPHQPALTPPPQQQGLLFDPFGEEDETLFPDYEEQPQEMPAEPSMEAPVDEMPEPSPEIPAEPAMDAPEQIPDDVQQESAVPEETATIDSPEEPPAERPRGAARMRGASRMAGASPDAMKAKAAPDLPPPVAPKPAPEPEPSQPESAPDPHDLVENAMREAMQGSVLARMHKVRQHPSLAGMSKEDFDKAVLSLRKQQRVELSRHDGPYQLSEEDRNNLVFEPGGGVDIVGDRIPDNYFNAMAPRKKKPGDTDPPQPSEPAPQQSAPSPAPTQSPPEMPAAQPKPESRPESQEKDYSQSTVDDLWNEAASEHSKEAMRIIRGKYPFINDDDIQDGITHGSMLAAQTFDASRGRPFRKFAVDGMIQAARNAHRRRRTHDSNFESLGYDDDGEQQSLDNFGGGYATPDDVLMESDEVRHINDIIDQLPEDDAQLFRDLTFAKDNGETHEQVAARHGLSRQTMRTKHANMLKHIRKMVGADEDQQKYQAFRKLIVRYYMQQFTPKVFRERYQRYRNHEGHHHC